MKSNFYIEQKHKSEFYQIIQYITDPQFKPKVKSYTGEKIYPQFWNKNDQTARGKTYSNLNDYLKSLTLKADSIRLKLKSEGKFTRENFIKEFIPDKRTKTTIYDYFDEWIVSCEKNDSETTDKERTRRTIEIYSVLKSILFDYESDRKTKLSFTSFDKEFYRDFKKYCLDDRENLKTQSKKGVTSNTFAGYVKVLKQFLGWLSENKAGMDQSFRKYRVSFTKSDDKPFKDEELRWLYDQDIYKYSYVKKLILEARKSDKHKEMHKGNLKARLEALERSRLVLLLLCCTGKRISDYQKMNAAEIDGDIIRFVTQKTTEVCYVPYFDDLYFRPIYVVNEMEKKFAGLPKVSDTNLRIAIKDLCKVIGFTRFPVKTKTGRKTHATIKTLMGVPPSITRIATGHKTEKSFNDYVEIDQFDVVKGYKDKATYLKAVNQ